MSHVKSSPINTNVDRQQIIAIRRETYNVWERRAPLSPDHVTILVEGGVKVIVQPSNRRVYRDEEYSVRGAIIQEDISEASLILGVKQASVQTLLPEKTYAFFSHTIKAQEENMPLLDAILKKNICLIDYEKMVDENGSRVYVAFGKFAGLSGMINILHGIGLRLLALGYNTPFMHIGPSHTYRNTDQAKQVIKEAGKEIAQSKLPRSLGPLTFVFTGTGNVSMGAQEMFKELPHEYISPEELPNISQYGDSNKLYACVVSRKDHYVRKDGGSFNKDEATNHPERYVSSFTEKIAPYATSIINGIYWAADMPRLLTTDDAKTLMQNNQSPGGISKYSCPLLAICDISADPGGSIGFIEKSTTIDLPFYLYDVKQNMERSSLEGEGILICSITNLPAQLAKEATDLFGSDLLPHIKDMLKTDPNLPFDDFDCSSLVKHSIIATGGSLTPGYKYIENLKASKTMSRL